MNFGGGNHDNVAATLSPTLVLSDQPLDQDGTARQMDQSVCSRDFSGAALVARGGHVLFQKAYGMANREHDGGPAEP